MPLFSLLQGTALFSLLFALLIYSNRKKKKYIIKLCLTEVLTVCRGCQKKINTNNCDCWIIHLCNGYHLLPRCVIHIPSPFSSREHSIFSACQRCRVMERCQLCQLYTPGGLPTAAQAQHWLHSFLHPLPHTYRHLKGWQSLLLFGCVVSVWFLFLIFGCL